MGRGATAEARDLQHLNRCAGQGPRELDSSRPGRIVRRLSEIKTVAASAPDITTVVNPQWRRLDSQVRSKTGQRHRLHAQFGAMALSEGLSEDELHTMRRIKP